MIFQGAVHLGIAPWLAGTLALAALPFTFAVFHKGAGYLENALRKIVHDVCSSNIDNPEKTSDYRLSSSAGADLRAYARTIVKHNDRPEKSISIIEKTVHAASTP